MVGHTWAYLAELITGCAEKLTLNEIFLGESVLSRENERAFCLIPNQTKGHSKIGLYVITRLSLKNYFVKKVDDRCTVHTGGRGHDTQYEGGGGGGLVGGEVQMRVLDTYTHTCFIEREKLSQLLQVYICFPSLL